MTGRWWRWFSVVSLVVATAALGAPAHAQITLPDVDLPTVKVAGLPEVQLPTVQTPDVEVPGVPLPEVTVPDVTVPDVTVPEVTAPSAPPPPTGGGDAGGSGGGSSAPSAGTTGGGASGGGGGGGGATARSAPSGAGGDGAGATPTRGSTAGGGATRPRTTRRVPATPGCDRGARCAGGDRSGPRERRLRQVVARLQGCLDAVTATQRRVLVLRAGVGDHDPLSRRAVARRLDTTPRAVRRTERRGVRALAQAARNGACGAAAGGGGEAAVVGGVLTAVGDADPPAGGTAPAGSDRNGDRTAVGGEFRSGPPGLPGSATPPGATARPPLGAGGGGDGDTPVLLLLALAFAGGFAVVWTLERRRPPGQPA